MDDENRREFLRVCDYFLRGIISGQEVCKHVIFSCGEAHGAADCLRVIPVPVLDTVSKYLSELPVSDEEWANYQGIGMLDGDEYAWAEMIAECRSGTEAIRAFLQNGMPRPESTDFRERVRTAYRDRMARMFNEADDRRTNG